MTGEALANAHKKFLSEYQTTVNGSDLDEDQLVAEIDNYKALLDTIDDLIRDAKTHRTDLERRSMNAYQAMQKRQEKLEKFREYSGQSASFFTDYQSSQSELNNGLAQVQDCKAWNASTGSFDITRLDMTWAKPINDRWEKREKMKQEELKKAEATKANTLAEHGLTEADLVQPNDPENVVLEKYIRLAQMGVNPHTGLPITDEEKWKFQYAAHTKTVFDVLGLVGGSYAGNKAFNDTSKKPDVLQGSKNGKNYTLDRSKSKGNYSYTKIPESFDLSKLKPREIAQMTIDELKNSIPKDWEFHDNNGRIHIKDENGNFRVRIDPPDKVTNYDHIHVFDSNRNPLDLEGNIVDRKSPDGHIPWNKK
ncbi:transposase [Enterococcus sp. 5H]|nr:transposase [Enterococcus sp. 5H]